MDDERLGAEIERIWREAGPPPKEMLSAVVKAVAAVFHHWLEAPSFRAGFPHLLNRRVRMKEHAARLLDASATRPEQLAAVMNKIRPGRIKAALKGCNRSYEMTAETAAHMQAIMTASELADLIETALEEGRPNDTDWVDAFDALWRVEVEAPRTGRKYDKDERDFIVARKARKVLGQRTDPTNRLKLKRGPPANASPLKAEAAEPKRGATTFPPRLNPPCSRPGSSGRNQ
jgi:hypothetical protein